MSVLPQSFSYFANKLAGVRQKKFENNTQQFYQH